MALVYFGPVDCPCDVFATHGRQKFWNVIQPSPHQEPQQHWDYDRENRNFFIKEGRRPGY